MNPFNKFFTNAGKLLSSKGTQTTPNSTDTIGVAGISLQDEREAGKQAIYPQWFYSARLGQPRGVDIEKLRTLSKSAWIQMVLSTFKKQIYSTDWDIVKIDEEDETDRTEDIKKVKAFFENINENGQNIDDINSELITDIGEIDAGCLNFIYTAESYDIGELPIWDNWGNVIGTETGLVLKPFGQRELVQIKSIDGGSMLKQVDIHKNLKRFYQYSFKHPRLNPTPFEKDEITYLIMNCKSYSVYGFSPVQSVQQVIELLIQGTRYNKDIFTNNAIPDMLATIPKLSDEGLKKLKRMWNNEFKGKPHQVGFLNWEIGNVHKLAESNRDLEWLDGQKWYFKLVFAVFGVSPTESGFFENSNKSNDEGQERVTVRNALKPYFQLFERVHTNKTICEILQNKNHGLKFEYKPKDQVREKLEFEQNTKELELGIITINEYRRLQGKEDVEWGDEPLRKPMDPTLFNDINSNPKQDENNVEINNENEQKYKKSFEEFLNGS